MDMTFKSSTLINRAEWKDPAIAMAINYLISWTSFFENYFSDSVWVKVPNCGWKRNFFILGDKAPIINYIRDHDLLKVYIKTFIDAYKMQIRLHIYMGSFKYKLIKLAHNISVLFDNTGDNL